MDLTHHESSLTPNIHEKAGTTVDSSYKKKDSFLNPILDNLNKANTAQVSH